MTDADVLVRKDDDVLRVTINRPRKHNALSRPLLDPKPGAGSALPRRHAGAGEDLDAAVERFIGPLRHQAPQVLRAFKALAREAREGTGRRRLQDLETMNFTAAWTHPDHWTAADKVLAKSDWRQ